MGRDKRLKEKSNSRAATRASAEQPGRAEVRLDEAAGGAVVALRDGAPSVVLIRTMRGGVSRWALPKGHFKKKETRDEAALREVREETGLLVGIDAPLGTIDYWFTEEGVRFHKFVHFYLMRALGGSLDDHDHEVVEARWFTIDEALDVMAYESERDLITRARAEVLRIVAKRE